MPESIGGSRSSAVNIAVRDIKTTLQRAEKQSQATAKQQEYLERNREEADKRENIRTTEIQRKSAIKSELIERKTEEAQQARRIEDKRDPKSGDIVNVVV